MQLLRFWVGPVWPELTKPGRSRRIQLLGCVNVLTILIASVQRVVTQTMRNWQVMTLPRPFGVSCVLFPPAAACARICRVRKLCGSSLSSGRDRFLLPLSRPFSVGEG
jgi:hypothetical protein